MRFNHSFLVVENNFNEKLEDYNASTCAFWKNDYVPVRINKLRDTLYDLVFSDKNKIIRENYIICNFFRYGKEIREKINTIITLYDEILEVYKIEGQEKPFLYFDLIEISHPRDVIIPEKQILRLIEDIDLLTHIDVSYYHESFAKKMIDAFTSKKCIFGANFFDRYIDILYDDNKIILQFDNADDYRCLKRWINNDIWEMMYS